MGLGELKMITLLGEISRSQSEELWKSWVGTQCPDLRSSDLPGHPDCHVFVVFLIYLDSAEHLWVILSEGGADVEGGSEKYFSGKINFRTELMEGRLQSILLCNLATKGGNGIINTLPKWFLFCLIMGFAIDRLIEFNGEEEEEGHWRSRKQSPREDESGTKDS